jgi:glycosyltransferase involved in cell wall biosynthesis
MTVLLTACGAAHLSQVARALQERNALAGLWVSTKNSTGIDADKFRRAWLFHFAMKPIYHLASGTVMERCYHALFPLWRFWLQRQRPPRFDVVQAGLGYGAEPFDLAEKIGALKVVDASSSHPTSFYGFWQRECDIFCPGASVAIPRWFFARANRDVERADLVLCASRFVRDSMVYNGISEAKCAINPFGVDTGLFTPRSSLPAKTRFVCVGGIGLRKGHQYLFRAFEMVRRVIPDAELACAGGYHGDFRIERRRWEGTFQHHPFLQHRELATLLRESTAFVLPSNEEGFARAIIEAMAAGLPIIATHESGATTLVEDGVHGLIVRARDVDHLAEAMVKLANDRALNERMGRAAHERGALNNSWANYADRLLKIFDSAIARKKQGSDTNLTN